MTWKEIWDGSIAGLPGALRGLLGGRPGKSLPREVSHALRKT